MVYAKRICGALNKMDYLTLTLGILIGIIAEKTLKITQKIKEYQQFRKTQKGAK